MASTADATEARALVARHREDICDDALAVLKRPVPPLLKDGETPPLLRLLEAALARVDDLEARVWSLEMKLASSEREDQDG